MRLHVMVVLLVCGFVCEMHGAFSKQQPVLVAYTNSAINCAQQQRSQRVSDCGTTTRSPRSSTPPAKDLSSPQDDLLSNGASESDVSRPSSAEPEPIPMTPKNLVQKPSWTEMDESYSGTPLRPLSRNPDSQASLCDFCRQPSDMSGGGSPMKYPVMRPCFPPRSPKNLQSPERDCSAGGKPTNGHRDCSANGQPTKAPERDCSAGGQPTK